MVSLCVPSLHVSLSKGENVARELQALVKDLPSVLEQLGKEAACLEEPIQLYSAFTSFVCEWRVPGQTSKHLQYNNSRYTLTRTNKHLQHNSSYSQNIFPEHETPDVPCPGLKNTYNNSR